MQCNKARSARFAVMMLGAGLASGAACSEDAPATVQAPLMALCVDDGTVIAVDQWMCGQERIVECNDRFGAYVDYIYVTADVFGDAGTCGEVDLVVSSDGPFAVGDSTVIVYAGDLQVCDSHLMVVDTTPPVVTVHDLDLWPPNHKMHDIVPSDCLTVFDACDSDVAVWFTGAASDEPMEGLGDGNFEPDIIDAGDGVVQLRAERAGGGNGRVYTLDWRAEDRWGNWTEGQCHVAVPHDQSKGWVQDAEAYRMDIDPE